MFSVRGYDSAGLSQFSSEISVIRSKCSVLFVTTFTMACGNSGDE